MTAGAASSLEGRIILVPAARVGPNPLARILERRGATARSWPELVGAPPEELGELDRAAASVGTEDWVVFVGELAAGYFLDRVRDAAGGAWPRIAAIGSGASRVLKARGHRPDVKPNEHTAEAVASALGELDGRRVLLVRGDRASGELPRELAGRGAVVREVQAFRTVFDLESSAPPRLAFGYPLDALALGNPTAVRILVGAAGRLGLELRRCLAAVAVFVAGPATARAAAEAGLEPDVVSAGHLADLASDLADQLGPRR